MQRALAGLLTLPLLLGGCAALSSSDSSSGSPSVAAAFYPLAFVSEQVAGDHAEVENLTSPGVEPHDLELSIRQTSALADADLVVHLSGFQPAVDDGIATNATGEVLDAADVVDLRPAGDHEHEDDHGDDHGDTDPHFWLDPLLMADLGDAMADELGDLDPEHRADYATAAADLRTRLEALDEEYAEGLASCERDTIVVSHDAFGYLERYGLHVESIVGLSPGAEPTAADLARLRELIESEGVTTVFSERLVDAELADSLARDAGVEVAVLDPIEGLTEATAEEDYVSLMQANLAALQEANAC